MFVHLRDRDDHTVSQVDRQPTAGSFPTSAWQVGDLIWDRDVLPVPWNARPGEYRLVVRLYRLDTMQRLMVRAEAGQPRSNEVAIGSVRVPG